MTAVGLLRVVGPLALALLATWAFDRLTVRRGFDPPGFAAPWRRALALLALALVLWAGVFAPLGEIGRHAELDPSQITFPRLFFLHELMVGAILVWFLAGFAGLRSRPTPSATVVAAYVPPPAPPAPVDPAAPVDLDPHAGGEALPPAEPAGEASVGLGGAAGAPLVEAPATPRRIPLGRQLLIQLGLATPNPAREVGLGVVLGVGAWMAVIVAVAIVAFFLLYVLGAKGALPKQPPALIPWLAGLPFGIRLLLALSAGVVEEGFFRGLLQPRMGIVLSTAMFILAHTVYGQPFLLIGVGILSVIYGLLVRWRQNIWAAMTAHALFDGVQLLVIIPAALKMMGGHLPAAPLGLF